MATVVLPETTRAFYPFKSHFLTLSDGKRMHYVDEGPEDGEVLVFTHGYPTWSFVFRAFLVYYAALGYRCIAMDHIGYGLSDKPTGRRYHTLRRHIHNLKECIQALNLHDITLVMEDWGGSIGLGYAIHHPDNIKRLVIMNAWAFSDAQLNRLTPLIRWTTRPGIGELLFGSAFVVFSIGMQRWSSRRLSSTILAAYRAPFRDGRSRRALVQFPRLINTTPSHPTTATIREIEQHLPELSRVPTLILWGEQNVLMPVSIAQRWKHAIPRATGPITIPHANHLLVEDAPDSVLEHLSKFLDHTANDPA